MKYKDLDALKLSARMTNWKEDEIIQEIECKEIL